MTHPETVQLSQIMARKSGSVDPSRFPDEFFDYYSIPAFDAGTSSLVPGREIGSSKQLIQAGDVLLSRIVPHIRRAWVVGSNGGNRIIGSGEWIVFRSTRFYPQFLRHLLVSETFHSEFMRTVSGVGGSLLRARPANVALISIDLPSIKEQRRIAAILDHAEALRAKRRQALGKLDCITQLIFFDMFGDLVNPLKERPLRTIADLCEVKGGKRLPKGKEYSLVETPYRYLRVMDFMSGEIDASKLVFLTPEVQKSIARYTVEKDDVVISIAGTIGRTAAIGAELAGANLTENAAKLVPKKVNEINAIFLAEALRTPSLQEQISARTGQVTIGKLALFRIEQLSFPLPAFREQEAFAAAAKQVKLQKAKMLKALDAQSQLILSLQHRAFRGEL